MEIIPLITLKKRSALGYPKSFLKDIIKEIKEDEKIYFLDLDGIEKDKPNFCTYQRISSSCDMWVDFGPKDLGDVVDAVMAGANAITLRKSHWINIELSDIRDITENKIFTNIDFNNKDKYNFVDTDKQKLDGLVNFYSREEIESSFQNCDYFKTTVKKKPTFTYESNLKNITYWKGFGIKGLIVDFDKLEEFKKWNLKKK